MSTTKTFNSSKFLNHKVRLKYDLEGHVVRLVCSKKDIAAAYLTKLIVDKKIGSVDSVIYSPARNSRVVHLLRGEYLNRFLRAGQQYALPKPKKRFSELADGSA